MLYEERRRVVCGQDFVFAPAVRRGSQPPAVGDVEHRGSRPDAVAAAPVVAHILERAGERVEQPDGELVGEVVVRPHFRGLLPQLFEKVFVPLKIAFERVD